MPVPIVLLDKIESIQTDAQTIQLLASQMLSLQGNAAKQNEAEWCKQPIIDLANRIVTIANSLPAPVP